MDVKILQDEMRKLSVLVDGWNSPDDISEIERDLVLGKLRTLYEAVRFAEAPSAGSESVEMPVGIDFGVAFSLDPLLPEESDTDEKPNLESSSLAEEGADSQLEYLPESEPAPEPLPAIVAEEQPVVSEKETPAAEAAPGEDKVAGPDTAVEAESAPQSIAPTLFGMEESGLRHRQKQRVIMSLYHDEPVVQSEIGALAASLAATESKLEPEPESKPMLEIAVDEPVVTPIPKTEHAAVAGYAAEPAEEDPFGENPFEEITVDKSEGPKPVEIPASGVVLGEVINHDVQTLADTIAPRRDVASELRLGESGGDLRRALGLNDKFLLIRDLFDGDGEACDAALERLNGFDDLDDCMIYIAENYAWNPNSDGAKFLMELIERKFA